MFVVFQFGGAFPEMIRNLENLGFFLYLFPFLLALAIIYGVLSWALKEQLPKPARGLIAIILSFFVMLYSSWNVMIVSFFANLTGAGLVVGTGILFIVVLLSLIGFDVKELTKGGLSKWFFILVIMLIGIVLFFGAGANWLVPVPSWSTTSEFWSVIFFVVIIAVVLYFLTMKEEEAKPAAPGQS